MNRVTPIKYTKRVTVQTLAEAEAQEYVIRALKREIRRRDSIMNRTWMALVNICEGMAA
jgi:hypothetical protein